MLDLQKFVDGVHDYIARALKPIAERLAAPPLQFPAHHHVGDRGVEDIAERVLPRLEGVVILAIRVVDVLARISDRG